MCGSYTQNPCFELWSPNFLKGNVGLWPKMLPISTDSNLHNCTCSCGMQLQTACMEIVFCWNILETLSLMQFTEHYIIQIHPKYFSIQKQLAGGLGKKENQGEKITRGKNRLNRSHNNFWHLTLTRRKAKQLGKTRCILTGFSFRADSFSKGAQKKYCWKNYWKCFSTISQFASYFWLDILRNSDWCDALIRTCM